MIRVLSLEHFYLLVGALTDQGELKHPPPTETTVASKKRAPKAETQKDYSKIQHTLAIFTAGWNDNCYFTQSLWVKLAARFTTPNLTFIEVDILRFETLARLYRVETSGFEKGLPALLLFEDGKTILRFPLAPGTEPTLDRKGGWFGSSSATQSVPQYYEKELIKYFDLDKRYLATSSVATSERKKAAT